MVMRSAQSRERSERVARRARRAGRSSAEGGGRLAHGAREWGKAPARLVRVRRIAALVLVVAPPAVRVASGCDDAVDITAAPPPIAGSTFGAQINVRVVGRGRVTSELPVTTLGGGAQAPAASVSGIDCPGSCYVDARMDPDADGAAAGFTLKAVTTSPTIRFDGWTFDATTPLGVRGMGPDSCNPMSRPGVAPPVDLHAEAITLAYGVTHATPPAGAERACAAYTNVPIAYEITAHFTDTDGGYDAGPPDLLYMPAAPGSTARELGMLYGFESDLVWRFVTKDGASGIARGPANATAPATPTVVIGASEAIDTITIDTNAIFQTASGALSILTPTRGIVAAPSAPRCISLASDANYVYCRSQSGTLVSWSALTGGLYGTIYAGLPPATSPGAGELVMDVSYFYMLDNPGTPGAASVRRFYRTTYIPPDAGPPYDYGDAVGRTAPIGLRISTATSRLFWIESDTAWSAQTNAGILTPTRLAAASSLAFVVVDPISPTQIFYGTSGDSGTIFSAPVPFLGETSVCRVGIPRLGGLAVDAKYIYFTQADGGVYRIPRSRCS